MDKRVIKKINKRQKLVCEKCGKEFEAGPKCQRSLCEECYKKDLQNRRNFARKEWRKRME